MDNALRLSLALAALMLAAPTLAQFPDAHDPPPAGWTGQVFKLRQDYPQTLPPTGSRPWTSISFKTKPNDYMKAVLAYALEGNKEADFVVQNNTVRGWYHAPWMHAGPAGREFMRGLTRERSSRPGELHANQTGTFENWAVSVYNPRGGYTLGRVWEAPESPNPAAAKFPIGAVSVKLIFTEAVANPSGVIADLEALADVAHAHNLPLVVDATTVTPYLCRPMEWGADIVIHSATKFLGGHGTSIAGVVSESGRFDWGSGRFPHFTETVESYGGLRFWENFGEYAFCTKLRVEQLRDIGACLSPFNAFLLLQGIETLPLRMDAHLTNTAAVSSWLDSHPQVSWVRYSGLDSSPYRALAQKYTPKGPGAVFAFGVKGGRAAGARFIENLELVSHLANIGDAKSLVIHPASTTHQQLTDEQLAAAGVGADLVRLSVGLEDLDDILWDLDQALQAAAKEA